MNDIESPIQESPIPETRAERGRRQRKSRRWKQGLLLLTGISACSVTLLTGALLTESTYSVLVTDANGTGIFEFAPKFGCGDGDDTHRNGDEHKDHPPGNGYGHCKPHKDGVLPEDGSAAPAEGDVQAPDTEPAPDSEPAPDNEPAPDTEPAPDNQQPPTDEPPAAATPPEPQPPAEATPATMPADSVPEPPASQDSPT